MIWECEGFLSISQFLKAVKCQVERPRGWLRVARERGPGRVCMLLKDDQGMQKPSCQTSSLLAGCAARC